MSGSSPSVQWLTQSCTWPSRYHQSPFYPAFSHWSMWSVIDDILRFSWFWRRSSSSSAQSGQMCYLSTSQWKETKTSRFMQALYWPNSSTSWRTGRSRCNIWRLALCCRSFSSEQSLKTLWGLHNRRVWALVLTSTSSVTLYWRVNTK